MCAAMYIKLNCGHDSSTVLYECTLRVHAWRARTPPRHARASPRPLQTTSTDTSLWNILFTIPFVRLDIEIQNFFNGRMIFYSLIFIILNLR